MASKTKDISLVIRAKDSTSKALKAISGAQKEFTDSLNATAKSAGRNSSVLSKLGEELGKLSGQLDSTKTKAYRDELTKTTQQLTRMERAQQQLQQTEQRTTATISQQGAALEATRNRIRDTANTILAAEDPGKRLAKTYESAIAELNTLGASLNNNKLRLTEITAAQITTGNSIDELRAKIEKASGSIRQSLLRTLSDSRTQLATFEQQWRDATAAVQGLVRGGASPQAPTPELSAAIEAARRLKTAYEGQQVAVQRMRDAVRAAGNDTAALVSVQRAFEDQEKLTQLAITATADAQRRYGVETLKSSAATEAAAAEQLKLADAATASAAALAEAQRQAERAGLGIRQTLLRALIDSRAQLATFEKDWRDATATVQGLVQGGARVDQPTPELSAAIEEATRLKAAYEATQVAMQRLRTGIREAGADTTKLVVAQRSFEAETKRVAAAVKGVADAHRAVSTAAADSSHNTEKANAATGRFSNTIAALNNNSRQALSLTQRLRGEVLSLTASYVGLYAVIQQLSGVTDAYRELESAQNRLAVAFEGDTQVVRQELQFLHDEAERLGVDFQVLTTQYSSFAVAIQQSPQLAGQVRELFVPFAEAGRVLNLTSEDLDGVFLAIRQMVNRSIVSMEELRNQLSERLVGAFELAAKSMKLTGQELIDFVSSGNLATATLLPKLAKQLEETFGPALPAAVKSLNAEISRFLTGLYDAQLLVARGGFLDGLHSALLVLNESFRSPEGVAFFENVGAAVGGLLKGLVQLVLHLDDIAKLFGVLIALRVSRVIQALAKDFGALYVQVSATRAGEIATIATTNGLRASMVALQASTVLAVTRFRAFAASLTVANVAGGLLRGTITAITALWKGLGGPIGILITAVTTFFSLWITQSEDATTALQQHEEQLNRVKDAYNDAGDASKSFIDDIGRINELEIVLNTENLQKQLEQLRKDTEIDTTDLFFADAFSGASDQLVEIQNQFKAGELSATQFKERIAEIGLANPALHGVIEDLLEIVNQGVDVENALERNAAAMRVLKDDATDADYALLGLERRLDAVSKVADPMERFREALRQVKEQVPDLAEELERLGKIKALDDLVAELTAIAETDEQLAALKEIIALSEQAKESINEDDDVTKTKETIAGLEEEIRLQRLKNQGKELEAAIEEALSDARSENEKITTDQETSITRLVTLLTNLKTAAEEAKAAQKTDETIAQNWTEIQQQTLKNQGKDREAFIEEKLTAAKKENVKISYDELQVVRAQAEVLFDLQNQYKVREEAEKRINDLMTLRTALIEQAELAQTNGDAAGFEQQKQAIIAVNQQLREAIPLAIEYWKAAGDSPEALAAIAKLETLAASIEVVTRNLLGLTNADIAKALKDNVVSGVDNFIDALSETRDVIGSLRDSFRTFAGDFLKQIAKMILQQAVFNALQRLGQAIGGSAGSILQTIGTSVLHTGGIAGSAGTTRSVASGWFANAQRYHDGGIAGLKPGEVPAILQRNEEVLTADDPRHVANGGGQQAVNVKVINAIDPGSFVSEGLNTQVGQQAVLNFVRANPASFNAALRG